MLINDLGDGTGCTLSNLQMKWEELLLTPEVALPFIEGPWKAGEVGQQKPHKV